MLSFLDYINEAYVNTQDKAVKLEYADAVWDILQYSYSKIGGIRGSGFTSKEDMVNNIDYWKIYKSNGIPCAVMLYKVKDKIKGQLLRKLVAVGTDGSEKGKAEIRKMMYAEIAHSRAIGEVSGAPLHIYNKLFNNFEGEYANFLVPAEEVSKYLGKEVEPTGKFTYIRKIGGEREEKVMYGYQLLKNLYK